MSYMRRDEKLMSYYHIFSFFSCIDFCNWPTPKIPFLIIDLTHHLYSVSCHLLLISPHMGRLVRFTRQKHTEQNAFQWMLSCLRFPECIEYIGIHTHFVICYFVRQGIAFVVKHIFCPCFDTRYFVNYPFKYFFFEGLSKCL